MTIFPGFILAQLTQWARKDAVDAVGDKITIDNHQANGAHGIHQARARMKGDPTTYRIIVAPADAPIMINGKPIGEHFAEPLGEM